MLVVWFAGLGRLSVRVIEWNDAWTRGEGRRRVHSSLCSPPTANIDTRARAVHRAYLPYLTLSYPTYHTYHTDPLT